MQTFLVGGAVRDALLNRKVTERDYVVVGATPEDMLEQGFTQVGSDFPVFLHPKTHEEYALARTERKSGTGYKGFICDASRTVTLEDDLLRRDLTVNAMAQSNDGTIIDPYNGQADLQQRVLRHVSEAFSEDPLRVFRVARFATRYAYLGFTIATETEALMTQMAKSGELKTLTAERIWQETKRSLLEKSPHVFFDTLHKIGALDDWFIELNHCYLSAMPVLNVAEKLTRVTSKDNVNALITRFVSLSGSMSESDASTLCKRLRVPNQVSEVAILACRYKEILLHTNTDMTLEANNLLSLFNGADAWRRVERFQQLLDALSPHAHVTSIDWESRRRQIENALRAANQVNVQDIIAQGLKGPEIRDALNNEKCHAIKASLN